MVSYNEFLVIFFASISKWLYPEERIAWKNGTKTMSDKDILELLIYLTEHPKSRRIFRGKEMSSVEFKQTLVQKAIDLSKDCGIKLYALPSYIFLSESLEMMHRYSYRFEHHEGVFFNALMTGIRFCSVKFLREMCETFQYQYWFDPESLLMLHVRLGMTRKIDEEIAHLHHEVWRRRILRMFKFACTFSNYDVIYDLQHKYHVAEIMETDEERCMIFSVRSFHAGMHFFKKFIGNFWNSEKIDQWTLLETLCCSNNPKTIRFFQKLCPKNSLFLYDIVEQSYEFGFFGDAIETIIQGNATNMFDFFFVKEALCICFGEIIKQQLSREMWLRIFHKMGTSFFDKVAEHVPTYKKMTTDIHDLIVEEQNKQRRMVFEFGFELGHVSSLFLETTHGSCQSALEFL